MLSRGSVAVGHNRVLLLVPPRTCSRRTEQIEETYQSSVKINSTSVSGISRYPDMKVSVFDPIVFVSSDPNPSDYSSDFDIPWSIPVLKSTYVI